MVYKKLPELSTPKFDGQLENWATFQSRFSSMINQNTHLSNSDKLQYLQTSLIGKATRAIASLEMTDSNYENTWQLLVEKYDNTRKAILRHVNILINLELLENNSAEAIDELVDTVHQHLRSLKNVGQSNEQWDCLIIGLLTMKISSDLTRQWELTLPDNKLPSYTLLIEFLAKRANCSDNTTPGSKRNANGKDHSTKKKNGSSKTGSGHQSFNTEAKAPECPMCKGLNCLRGQHKTK